MRSVIAQVSVIAKKASDKRNVMYAKTNTINQATSV